MRPDGVGLNVLILDDDVPFLGSFEDLLVQDGHTVYSATTGFEAIEIASRVPFDLSVLDCELPDLDGIETFLRIQKERPRLPAIFISGSCSPVLEERVLQAGGFVLLRKPLQMPLVRRVMREVILFNKSKSS